MHQRRRAADRGSGGQQEQIEERNTYLRTFDGTILSNGSHTVDGTVVVRTPDKLNATQQKKREAKLIGRLQGWKNSLVGLSSIK